MKPRTCGDSGGSLNVSEIFFSIQGESVYAGRPCVFVRLAGCNLRCTYCDTRYAWTGGSKMQIQEIISAIRDFRFPLVEITGGEPLLQENTPELVRRLFSENIEVLIETNGTLPIDLLPRECVKIMDIKCPGSGQSRKTDFDNIGRLGKSDQVKFVICSREDYDFGRGIIERYLSDMSADRILISPAAGFIESTAVADWMLKDRLNARLQLQLHKILWPDKEKGV